MRIIVALLLAGLLSACGLVQMAYNNSPELVYRWLDDYADFNDEQMARVRADIERLHLWHRVNELPRYAQLLERLARQAPDDLTVDGACAIIEESRTRLDALIEQAEPSIAAIAVDFRPDQFQHLERKFAKVNAKYREERVDSPQEKRNSERFRRAVERAERVYGRLDDPQFAVIRAQIEKSSFDPHKTFAEMQRRQRDTVATLERIAASPSSPAEVRAAVQGWLDRMQHSPDAEYRAYQQAMTQESCANIAGLHNSTSAAQRAHAARRLAGYARDLNELSAQAVSGQ